MAHLNLRQICLVAPAMAPAERAFRAIFGLEVCHRDAGVAKYGLENVLFVFGRQFLEVVAPTREGTAVGRFIDKAGGPLHHRGGYMAIFDCDDPERRRALAESLGVRIAHTLDYPGFFGNQFHPRDCRAAMLEFDRTPGGHDLDGPYWPAGPHWRDAQDLGRASGLPLFEVESPDAAGLAAHWARLCDRPLLAAGSAEADAVLPAGLAPRTPAPALRFDLGAVRFVQAAAGTPERLSTLVVACADPAGMLAAARQYGCIGDAHGFELCGVRFEPVPG